LFAGTLSDRFGRKPLLLVSGLLFVVTSIGTGLAPNFHFFVGNRLLGGVAIGIASNLSPLYIAEIAPAGMRGRLVSVNQLTIAIGVMLAQIVNWLIAQPTPPGMMIDQIPLDSWNVQIAWRWMFGVTAVPAAVFFAAMFFVPESPRWLAKKRPFPEIPGSAGENRRRGLCGALGEGHRSHIGRRNRQGGPA